MCKKTKTKIHIFENDHFLFLFALNKSLLRISLCLSLSSHSPSIVFIFSFIMYRLHLEICSHSEMSCDFMRYLFCGLVLGDKRWQDFICILVCVYRRRRHHRWLLYMMRCLRTECGILRNVTRRQCKVSSKTKKSSF